MFRQNEVTGNLKVGELESWHFASWQLPVWLQLQCGCSCSFFAIRWRLRWSFLRTRPEAESSSRLNSNGRCLAPSDGMKEPSAKRKRTLELHERAIRFSVNVNACCPKYFSDQPSKVVWGQLVRAADGTSSNLVEADDAVSDADFLNKLGTALKEAKESNTQLTKLRLGTLDNYAKTANLGLESEATQLSAIYATIIRNMAARLEREKDERKRRKRKDSD